MLLTSQTGPLLDSCVYLGTVIIRRKCLLALAFSILTEILPLGRSQTSCVTDRP